MSILERVKREEKRRVAAAAHHEVERAYNRGFRPNFGAERDDLRDTIGTLVLGAATILTLGYLLLKALEAIR